MKPTPNTTITLTALTVTLLLFISACGAAVPPSPTMDVNVFYTQAAATIAMGMTQTSQAMPSATPQPTATPKPSATPNLELTLLAAPTNPIPTIPVFNSPTPIPIDPATAHGCYNATFIADLNLRYASPFNPGDKFTKTWRVRNTGTCDWPRGFQLIYISGDRFGADSTTLGQKVLAGGTADISVAMTAPDLSGVVTSNWTLATDIGKPFGPLLFVSITLPTTGSGPSSSGGCLNSILISDVSIPTGTQVKANESFTKTWLVKNNGTCEWNGDYKITFVGGDTLGADTTKIRRKVGPNSSTEISLNMSAPGSKGTVSSAWQLSSDNGQLFGQLFAFSITVK